MRSPATPGFDRCSNPPLRFAPFMWRLLLPGDSNTTLMGRRPRFVLTRRPGRSPEGLAAFCLCSQYRPSLPGPWCCCNPQLVPSWGTTRSCRRYKPTAAWPSLSITWSTRMSALSQIRSLDWSKTLPPPQPLSTRTILLPRKPPPMKSSTLFPKMLESSGWMLNSALTPLPCCRGIPASGRRSTGLSFSSPM